MRLIRPAAIFITALVMNGCQTTAPHTPTTQATSSDQAVTQSTKPETPTADTSSPVQPTAIPTETTSAVAEVTTASKTTSAAAPACPVQPAQICKAQKSPIGDMVIIGEVENTRVTPGDFVTEARIDTGATTTSIHALDVVEFERDGKKWVKFKTLAASGKGNQELERQVTRMVSIKRHGAEDTIRYAVNMTLTIGTLSQHIEVTLADRSSFDYKVLVGRNLLHDLFVVDVGKKLTTGTPSISGK